MTADRFGRYSQSSMSDGIFTQSETNILQKYSHRLKTGTENVMNHANSPGSKIGVEHHGTGRLVLDGPCPSSFPVPSVILC